MKKIFAFLIILCFMLSPFTAFAEAPESAEAPLSVTLDVLNRGADAFYGCDVNISIKDFIALGFELGDACNVVLENDLYRYEFKSVPFYNGYYTKTGDPLLCAYGYAIKENRGPDYEYTRTDYPYRLTYSKDFEDYEAKNGVSKEEVFANFRAVKSAAMKENVLFRSASPFDNANNRAPYVDELAKANGIDYILDLADSQKKLDKYKEAEIWPELDYARQLLDNDQVCLMSMSAAYEGAAYQAALVNGLNSALEHNATKILFHCTEGKDRTGFVGLVLEGLCGASYEEMLQDYMVTYDNYYNLTEESDKTAYDYIVELKFNDMVNYLLSFDPSLEAKGDGSYDLAGVTAENFAAAARNLLAKAGMSEDNLDALTALLKK